MKCNTFDFQPRTRVIFGAGVITRLGELARELNFKSTLLVADRGLVASGHVDEALAPLSAAGIEVVRFHDFEANPDSTMLRVGQRLCGVRAASIRSSGSAAAARSIAPKELIFC